MHTTTDRFWKCILCIFAACDQKCTKVGSRCDHISIRCGRNSGWVFFADNSCCDRIVEQSGVVQGLMGCPWHGRAVCCQAWFIWSQFISSLMARPNGLAERQRRDRRNTFSIIAPFLAKLTGAGGGAAIQPEMASGLSSMSKATLQCNCRQYGLRLTARQMNFSDKASQLPG